MESLLLLAAKEKSASSNLNLTQVIKIATEENLSTKNKLKSLIFSLDISSRSNYDEDEDGMRQSVQSKDNSQYGI